jgi:hypothetical protein
MSLQVQIVDATVMGFATVTDYYRIFAEDMESLYLMAFLLTADIDKAEQCFVSGLGECIDRVGVPIERVRSWARRAVVMHAIRITMPVPEGIADELFGSAKRAAIGITRNPFAAILSLGAFERSVFVMSVLEGQSDEDCQELLKCSRLEVVTARELAFRFIATSGPRSERPQNGNYTWPALLH